MCEFPPLSKCWSTVGEMSPSYSGKIEFSLLSLHFPLAAGNKALTSFGETIVIQVVVTSSLSPALGTWPKQGFCGIEIGSKVGLPMPDR